MANGLISFNLLFLFLLLLTPLANSMEIQDETDLQPSLNPLANSKGEKVTEAKPPQSSSTGTKREKGEKSVSFHESAKKSEPDPLEDKVTQEELAAVNGDISAVYIIRIINKRAEALKKLKTEAMAKIPDGFAINKEFNKANKPDEETDAVHDDQQKLNKAKKGKKDKTRKIYADLWSNSNLLDAEMEELNSRLAWALKKERNKMFFLDAVKLRIEKFQTKKPVSHSQMHNLKERIGKVVRSLTLRRLKANAVELCKELRQEYLNFLKQIRLEVKLHYSFKSLDLGKFRETADNLKNPEYLHMALVKLHDAAKNVYMDIVEVLRSPLRHQQEEPLKKEHKFVTSLLEVAQIAQVAEGKEPHDLTASIYLNRIFNMAGTVDSTLRTQTPETKIHDEIGEKLEMPREWFERMRAQAYPPSVNVKPGEGLTPTDEEKLTAQVDILLAKTLLVYERLNKFYRIDLLYKMWKNKLMHKHKKYRLLESYFDQFKNEKMGKHSVAASSSAQANNNETV